MTNPKAFQYANKRKLRIEIIGKFFPQSHKRLLLQTQIRLISTNCASHINAIGQWFQSENNYRLFSVGKRQSHHHLAWIELAKLNWIKVKWKIINFSPTDRRGNEEKKKMREIECELVLESRSENFSCVWFFTIVKSMFNLFRFSFLFLPSIFSPSIARGTERQ